MLTIAVVLKSGGCYDLRYVNKLHEMIDRYLHWRPYEFVCLTDISLISMSGRIIPLTMDLFGWWSKIELFQLKGSVIYFDLDTIILRSIDNLAEKIVSCGVQSDSPNSFYMLRAFRAGETWASGIMAWTGDWSWLMNEFDKDKDIPRRGRSWEQRYIKEKLKSRNVKIRAVNDYLPKIYSYRHHCKERIPYDAEAVCFHGNNKPHNVGWLEEEICKRVVR